MPRPRTKGIGEYQPLAPDSEALWALLWTLAVTVMIFFWDDLPWL